MSGTEKPTFPQQYGKYELLERIGEGGMAEVFRARLPGAAGFEKILVIKRILPHLAKKPDFVRMFVDEAKLAAKVQHQNVVQVFELGETESGELFMAMEYVSGVDLRRLLVNARERRLRIPVWFVLHTMAEVLNGLTYAHELSDGDGHPLHVVHRDVTPGNIFISYQGEVKLADFGIAKAVGRVSETEAGQVKGNAPFMAPEAIYGRTLDARADVFSAGIVLWASLALRLPFEGSSNYETAKLVCEAKREPPSKYNALVPPELDAIALGALEIERSRRIPSAREFQARLLELLSKTRPKLLPSDVRHVVDVLTGRKAPDAQFSDQRPPSVTLRREGVNQTEDVLDVRLATPVWGGPGAGDPSSIGQPRTPDPTARGPQDPAPTRDVMLDLARDLSSDLALPAARASSGVRVPPPPQYAQPPQPPQLQYAQPQHAQPQHAQPPMLAPTPHPQLQHLQPPLVSQSGAHGAPAVMPSPHAPMIAQGAPSIAQGWPMVQGGPVAAPIVPGQIPSAPMTSAPLVGAPHGASLGGSNVRPGYASPQSMPPPASAGVPGVVQGVAAQASLMQSVMPGAVPTRMPSSVEPAGDGLVVRSLMEFMGEPGAGPAVELQRDVEKYYNDSNKFLVRFADGTALTATGLDECLSFCDPWGRRAIALSIDNIAWMELPLFARLCGLDYLAPDQTPLKAVALVGQLEERSLSSVFAQLARGRASGRLVIMDKGVHRVARREIDIVAGAPVHVYADHPSLQYPQLFVQHRLVKKELVPELVVQVLKQRMPIEEVARRNAFVDLNPYRPIFMRDRLAEIFTWRYGRFAFDVGREQRGTQPFAPSLVRVLPDAVQRGYSVEELVRDLDAYMNVKLRRADTFDAVVQELALKDKHQSAAKKLGQRTPLAQTLKKYPAETHALLAMSRVLLDLEVLLPG